MKTWSQAAKDEFPEDEDEFEESICLMKARLEEIILDESHKYRTEYFLTGYESAYKIIASWLKDLRDFKDVYDETNKEAYMEIRMLLDENSDETTKEEVAFMLLEKSIPEEERLTDTERGLYARLWMLEWFHDVHFGLKPYSDLFQEGEYTQDNYEQWVEDWTSYERLDLYSLCADVYEYLNMEQPEDFQKFAKGYVEQFDLPRSFFAFLEERKV